MSTDIGRPLSLSVIIPVYQNRGSLRELHQRLQAVARSLPPDLAMQVIAVDDGSTDGSHEELLGIRDGDPGWSVIRHWSNQGSMSAIRTGIRHATGGRIVFLAADLQDPPEIIAELMAQMDLGHRWAIAVRRSRQDPLTTRLGAWLTYRLIRWLVASDFPPTGFDLMMFDRRMIPHLMNAGHRKNIGIQAWLTGPTPGIIAYDRQERRHGTSQWTFRKKLRYLHETLIGFSLYPVRLMARFGLFMASACFLYVAFVVIGRWFHLIEVPGFATIVALIGFLHGCGFLMLGLVAEYIWRFHAERQTELPPLSDGP